MVTDNKKHLIRPNCEAVLINKGFDNVTTFETKSVRLRMVVTIFLL